ncbi:nuclear factor erythroid 2-related factor 3 [Lampris incognitus]|uniref:nuclear factor erythroid 2-related factor 3 n=1 Tax=Lampris incognitus TaxID=2546036 RepID=UPI0024B553E9|nr:nuclear factor erythroid 2-related factor 3 [Lampris incognitus]
MQIAKKYLTEGLIQFTILLSLIGVRVDVDSYLNGYYTPLFEISLGPSSAYTQTPFHSLRDTLDGYSVHPKCPELDYFFASRRLLDEVRALGSPRFPTQLNAWLLHQVPDSDKPDSIEPSDGDDADTSLGSESTGGDAGDDCEHPPDNGHQTAQHLFGQGPCSSGTGEVLGEEENGHVKEEEPGSLSQLAHSIALEQESLLDSNAAVFDPARSHPPAVDIDQQWSHFLSLPVSDLDDLDPLDTECFTDLDADITSTISQDVSLHDAMVSRAAAYDMVSERTAAMPVAQQQAPFFCLESTNSSHSDSSMGMTMDLAALPFVSVCNVTRNLSSHVPLDGCLDEAVFDQINLLHLDDLGTIDSQMLDNLGAIDPQLLEDLDSDSGLSLENSSRGPASPGTSEVSSSSSSYCEDGCGATGYTSEVDSIPSKGIFDHTTSWSPVDLSESVWHDHSYSSPAFFHQPSVASFPHKGIKEEPLSEEEDQRVVERELSRDEMRARAMCIPFSAMQIVNMPVEEFLDVLEGHGFSPEQVTLLRDIRRRGKNKLAAQNCRKRKLDAITGLQGEVEKLQAQRDRLFREKQLTAKTLGAVSQQIDQLTRDILSRMRNDLGEPLSPQRYTLQCGANGRVVVHLVRKPITSTTTENKNDKRKKDKKL